MIAAKHRGIQCGQVSIQFITNQDLNEGDTVLLNTRTGIMRVSTPETTAKDLLMFIRQSGGIGQIATVIDELADKLNKDKLQAQVQQSSQWQWVQRLGYMLEILGNSDLADSLFLLIKDKALRITPLAPNRTMTGFPRNKKWRLAINAKIESDLDDDTN